MVEQELEIVTNGQYKNINLKPRPLKGIKGLEDGNFILQNGHDMLRTWNDGDDADYFYFDTGRSEGRFSYSSGNFDSYRLVEVV